MYELIGENMMRARPAKQAVKPEACSGLRKMRSIGAIRYFIHHTKHDEGEACEAACPIGEQK